MILRVEFLSGADVELQAAFNHFENYRNGFGLEFLTVVEACLARIAGHPDIAPLYLDDVHRQVMQRFPYGIYVPYPTRVVVIAILDLRQDQERIFRRLRA